MTKTKEDKPDSIFIIILKVVVSLCFTAILAVAIMYYVRLLIKNDKLWLDKLYIVFAGLAVAFVLSLVFDTPHRRMLVNMFRGMGVMMQWDAGNLFMSIVMKLLLVTYGSIVVVCVAALYSPVSIWIWPWQKLKRKQAEI